MGAAAERWYEGEAADEVEAAPRRRGLEPVEDRDGRTGSGAGGAQHDETGPRWNVLAEELVAYPPRAQQIWLDHPASGERSRSYATAWLDRELESLRTRRQQALARPDPREFCVGAGRSAVEPREPGTSRPSGGPALVGDPGTVARPAATPRPRPSSSHLSSHLSSHRRARFGGLVAASTGTRAAIFGPRGLRRLLPGAATLAVLVATWFGVGALATSAHAVSVVPPAGAVATSHGYVYFARPGDTLWSIASKAEPGADPRPLVDELQAQLGGRTLQPGDRLVLPRTAR